MDDSVRFWEEPTAKKKVMIAGWRQWADAGSVSSELPGYLIGQTGAKKIGDIKPDGFYLFQIPGTHDLLRPKIKLDKGYRKGLEPRRNEFFFTGSDQKGLVVFLGEEPHLDVGRYAEAFFDAVEGLEVQRVAVLGGVYGAVPYDRDRQVSCVYSLPGMKSELTQYAVKFSNYEGGAGIGTFLTHRAERRGIEFVAFYVAVPFYDFGKLSIKFAGIKLESDYKAWYDLMKRISHLFSLGLDLSNLERKGRQLVTMVGAQIDEIDRRVPQLRVKERIDELTQDFVEMPFPPLSEVWKRELGHLFGDRRSV